MQNVIVLTDNPEAFKQLLRDVLKEVVSTDRPQQTTSDILLTFDEACKLLNVSKTTLTEWKKQGIVPFIKLGKRVYFEKQKLIEAGRGHEKYTRKK